MQATDVGSVLSRAYKRVQVSEVGCHEWPGATNRPGGYGQVKVGGRAGKVLYLHRLSFEAVHGEVPSGLYVLHRCDNPRCINPAHLFAGSQRDNLRDCAAKGRIRNGSSKA